MKNIPSSLLALLVSICVLSCKVVEDNTQDDLEETGQQVGDIMASVDEIGGSSGAYAALHDSAYRTFARVQPTFFRAPTFFTDAHAGACSTDITFGGCSAKTLTRNFNGCTIGGTTLNGTVTLAYANTDNNCLIDGTNETVSRTPDFTITGRRGATLSVKKSGSLGQVLKRTGTNTFTFENDGVVREFTTAAGQSIFKLSTITTSPIGITGNARSGRVVNGGSLKINDQLTNIACDVVPNNVTWTDGCNCATSGNWAGTCSDGNAYALLITGCGTASVSKGTETVDLVFDRCY